MINDLQDRLSEIETKGESGVVEIVDHLITDAIGRGSSDIHLEPTDAHLSVRYRIDGVLQRVARIDVALQGNIISRIKVLADLLTYRTDIPQEGRIESGRHGGGIDLRVSTFPTIHGEKAVIRIFDPAKKTFELHELGFPSDVLSALQEILLRPQGVLLLTGPSGSGKTTSIYSALRHIVEQGRETRNVVTVEDPVEYAISGTTQTQVSPAAGLTFARCLRSLMRQDPEVIMIGEIRDTETAKIAIEAGLTGHLVISTIHSGTACGVFDRLLEMGIEPYLLSASITGVLAQRLVRILCDKCKKPACDEDDFAGLRDLCNGQAYIAAGCDNCMFTGYTGRNALAEILVVDSTIRQRLSDRTGATELEKDAIESGMLPLRDRAADMLKNGLTSPQDLRRVMVLS